MAISEAYGRVSRGFWSDPDIKRKLTTEQKALLLYYFTGPHSNMAGLYAAPFEFTASHTGLPVERVREWTLGCLAPFVSYDEDTEEVLVHRLARHQIGDNIDPKDKRLIGVKRLLASAHSLPLVRHFAALYPDWPVPIPEAPSKPLPSPFEARAVAVTGTEQEQEQEQNPPGDAVASTRPIPVDALPVDVHAANGNGHHLVPGLLTLDPQRRVTGGQVLCEWIKLQPAAPSEADRAKQGAAAGRLAQSHTAAEIGAAFLGISQVWPHAPPKSEPWDLFDLERRFPKALAAAANHPEVRRQREDAEFDMTLSSAGFR